VEGLFNVDLLEKWWNTLQVTRRRGGKGKKGSRRRTCEDS